MGYEYSYHLLVPSHRPPPSSPVEVWPPAGGIVVPLDGSARLKTLEGETQSQGLPGWGEVKLSKGEGLSHFLYHQHPGPGPAGLL